MDYRCVTNKNSQQYKLIHSDSIKVCDDGLLRDGEYIGVALGSKFGNVGDKFVITLDTGKQFKVIMVERKADKDTVDNCHHESDGSLVEFVIDVNLTKQHYPMAITMGNFNYIEQFNGKVVKVEREV